MSKSLPQPFQLPENFPESVEEEIETGQLSAKERKRFMLTVANAIFDHTMYPSNVEYNHVAEQIVRKYSFMGDKKGSHVSNYSVRYVIIRCNNIPLTLCAEV